VSICVACAKRGWVKECEEDEDDEGDEEDVDSEIERLEAACEIYIHLGLPLSTSCWRRLVFCVGVCVYCTSQSSRMEDELWRMKECMLSAWSHPTVWVPHNFRLRPCDKVDGLDWKNIANLCSFPTDCSLHKQFRPKIRRICSGLTELRSVSRVVRV